MADLSTIDLSDLNNYIDEDTAFLCWASFEFRGKTISLALDTAKTNASYIFYDCYYDATPAASEISEHLDCGELKLMDLSNPTRIADTFAKVIEEIRDNGIERITIDITTFTHESLLILLRILLLHKESFKQIRCLYTGAQDYGGTFVPPEQKWLSKGCKDVRNVVGYPGILRPSAKTCLIVLAGFELERATRLIELIEPDRIAIGNGIEPVNENLSDTVKYFRNRFDDWRKEYRNRNCESFEFSCKDIISTVALIEKIVGDAPNDNFILVPLNTKLSTIASALVAFRNPKIQLCYSIPEIYNMGNYSTPDSKITIFDLDNIESCETPIP